MAPRFITALTLRKAINHKVTGSSARIRAVYFDLGSTLLYFDTQWPEALNASDNELFAALRQYGYQLDQAAFLAEFQRRMEAYFVLREDDYLEYTTESVLRRLLADFGYPEIPSDVLQAVLSRKHAITQAHWQPETDALPTLKALKKADYKIGLISNASDAADVQALIDKAKIRPYLQSIVISAEFGQRKPAPGIFEHALQKLGVAPAEAVMVGDTLNADVAGAHNLEMRAVWISRRVDTPENRRLANELHPDGIITMLDELPPLLERWNANT